VRDPVTFFLRKQHLRGVSVEGLVGQYIGDCRARRRLLVSAAFLFLLGIAGCGAGSGSSAHLYWASVSGIGRANLDGSHANRSFITHGGFTVTLDRSHVYWTDTHSGGIGRATLTGSGANPRFIIPGISPFGLAVDKAHVYWTIDEVGGKVGRANLDGSHREDSFIPRVSGSAAVAVGATHLYWTDIGTSSIGRANLDGSDVNRRFISGLGSPVALAVADGRIYWSNMHSGMIGRANLDGSDVNRRFIATNTYALSAIAVDSTHIYWGGSLMNPNDCAIKEILCSGVIGRATLDGSGITKRFILTGEGPVTGLALGP
jgi:hypothetical protein